MPPPTSASSGSCSTTAGSPAVATTPPGLGDWFVDDDGVAGRAAPARRPRARRSAWSSGCGSSPRWSTPTATSRGAHPDWILRGRMALPPSARQQQVLDLAHPEAYAYIAGRLHALLDEYPIAYLKWDHNRDLVDAGTGPEGVARVREHTLARLPAARRAQGAPTPGSRSRAAPRAARGSISASSTAPTASGPATASTRSSGSRTSATPRCVVPPELMGMHLTSPVVHSSGRTVAARTSARAVALFGHFGIEWDLTTRRRRDPRARSPGGSRSPSDCGRSSRPAGRSTSTAPTRASTCAAWSPQTRSSAVFTITQTETTVAYPAGRVRLPGLDPGAPLPRARRRRRRRRATTPASPPLEWAHHRHRPDRAASSPPSASARPSSSPSSPPSSSSIAEPLNTPRTQRKEAHDDTPNQRRASARLAALGDRRDWPSHSAAARRTVGRRDDPELLPVQGRGARGLQPDHRRLRGREPRHPASSRTRSPTPTRSSGRCW